MGMETSGSGTPSGSTRDEELLEATNEWVRKALVAVTENNGTNYMRMVNDMREMDLDDLSKLPALLFRLRAVAQNVYYIKEQYHQALLEQVLGMSLWNCNGDVGDILMEFVVNLTTANGGCVRQCIEMLVRNFLPPSCGLPFHLDTYSKAKRIPMDKIRSQKDEHLARKEDVLNRLHDAIKQITSLVPTTALRLLSVVLRRTIHRSFLKEWTLLYLENMLRLESSGGQYLANQMLPGVVDLLIQIDVEIKWEDIIKEESGNAFIFHMEDDEDIGEREPDGNEPQEEDSQVHPASMRASQMKLSTLDEMAQKMDAMMDMTLAHLQFCVKSGRSQQVYEALMKSFQASILHTHRSKFTQFLIFFMCSLEPKTIASHFADLLCNIIISKNLSPTTRISAAAYLASYLARAKFLSESAILLSLTKLVGWCISYGGDDVIHYDAPAKDKGLHGVFFSVCQAVMYTLCFRFRMLNNNLEGKRALRSLHLQELVNHRLSPLTVCLPSVVEEFLKRARMLQLVDQNTWLKVKDSVERRTTQNDDFVDSRLDMFFPFDPYLLHDSDRFIRPSYNTWSMVQSLEEKYGSEVEGSDGDSDSDDSSDLETRPRNSSPSPGSNVGSFGGEEHFEETITRSASLTISRKIVPVVERSYSGAGASPYSDDEFVDSFHDSFDAMAITPPNSQKMPAKLPAKLPADFSHLFGM